MADTTNKFMVSGTFGGTGDVARRDYFIGQALAGLCARYGVKQDASDMAQAAIVLAIETIKAINEIWSPPPVK